MNPRVVIGPLLVLLGAYLLLNPGGVLSPGQLIGYFWASMFIIPLGVFFHWLYFQVNSRKGVGLLVPGGILLTVGIVCQISMLTGGWEYMWPGFIMAPAIGLFELYWFGGRNKWLLIPINILMILSMLFFMVFTIGSLFSVKIFGQPFLAIVLILGGAVMLIRNPRKSQE